MNYAQKYNKLIKAVKALQQANPSNESIKKWVADNVPELFEPDDEAIRKALMEYFGEQCDMSDWNGIYGYQVYNWLKKQGEKNPIEWSEENEIDKEILNAAILFATNSSDEFACNGVSKEDVINWLKSIKQQLKQKWSNEDEHRVKDIIYFLDTAKKHYASTVELDACIDWLKSLRPQPKQEWNEGDKEMIECLNNCLDELEGEAGWRYIYVNNKNVELNKVRNWLKSLRSQNA